jgi:xanthine/CO dehydrogenase XdhC/CoxF family maturation factor
MEALGDIVEAARALRLENPEYPFLLATVVNAGGDPSLRLGGHLLIAEGGRTDDRWVGPGSGRGTPVGEFIRKAWWFTRDGVPALLRHTATGEEIDWRLGLAESGSVDLLVVPCDVDDPYDPVAFFEQCLLAQTPGAVATVLRSDGGRPGLGTRLQIGPDGVPRSQIGDCRLTEAFADRTRQVLATGRSEIYVRGGMEALIEAVIPAQLDASPRQRGGRYRSRRLTRNARRAAPRIHPDGRLTFRQEDRNGHPNEEEPRRPALWSRRGQEG